MTLAKWKHLLPVEEIKYVFNLRDHDSISVKRQKTLSDSFDWIQWDFQNIRGDNPHWIPGEIKKLPGFYVTFRYATRLGGCPYFRVFYKRKQIISVRGAYQKDAASLKAIIFAITRFIVQYNAVVSMYINKWDPALSMRLFEIEQTRKRLL